MTVKVNNSSRLTPSVDEVVNLAREEASVDHWSRFQPICRGPLFAIVALTLIVLSAIPWIMFRQLWPRRR